jgi:hypothetical protein
MSGLDPTAPAKEPSLRVQDQQLGAGPALQRRDAFG